MIERSILDDLATLLTRRDDVVGVAVLGSFARGRVRPSSDLDIIVLTNAGDPSHVEAFECAGRPTEVFFVREDVIRAELDRPKGRKTIATWAGGITLHDTDARLHRLLSEINERYEQGPLPMDDEERTYGRFELAHVRGLLEEAALDTTRHGRAVTRFLISHAVRLATELLLRHDRRWPVGLRETLAALRSADPASADLAEQALTEEMGLALPSILTLIERTQDRLGGPLDEGPQLGVQSIQTSERAG